MWRVIGSEYLPSYITKLFFYIAVNTLCLLLLKPNANRMYLSVNFLSVPYMFYPLSCTVAVKSAKFKKKNTEFLSSKKRLNPHR